jgi:putative ABC transport system permease protein
MIMSVFTRIREIAILRVNGFSGVQIAGIIFGESALVSLAGALAGLLFGSGVITGLQHVPMLHGYIDGHIQFAVVAAVMLLAGFTGVAGAFYPAIYAMRIRAVDALRFE